MDSVRVDVWMWAVRLFRTRTASTAACTSGTVRVNGIIVKPSRKVGAGDIVSARAGGRARIVEVVSTPSKRVGASVAAEAYNDQSPRREPPKRAASTPPAQRDPGAGRPTKRDRRQIDRLRGR